MLRTQFLRAGAVASLCVLGWAAAAQERDRTRIPEKYKWNLSEIYPDEAAWRSAKETLQREIPELGSFKDRLSSSGAALADALERISALEKTLARLYTYTTLSADEDTRDSRHQGMRQEMTTVASAFEAETSFVQPEILRIDKAKLQAFVNGEPRLKVYRFYLDNIARRAAHTLGDKEEKLLADLGPLAASPSSTFGILSNADFPYPTVSLHDGRSVKLDQAAYNELRALPDRGDREKVMAAFFGALGSFSRTFGTTMNAEVQKVLFVARARRYGSNVEASLDENNIPVTVYTRLIDGVNRNLPVFHRYLKLRKRMMGVGELHYYDLYAPLVGSVKLDYSPDEAQQLVLDAVAPLGPEYQSVIQRAFEQRWIDLMPTAGKRSGAYSHGGVYDLHPYMLINFNGKYADVSTLAHELGHTMQSYFSNRTQPFPLASYPIFVAEVASTFNESLLVDHALKRVTDPDARLALLGNYLENIKATVFRQTQFAEFELRMHQMAEKGQPLTGDALAKLYADITKRYYGHDQKVTVVDDYVAHEWSFVPHFYRDFYVFQYATSFTASLALAEKVKAGDPEATKRYVAFLSAGGSKYPVDLLKDAGVDMTTPEPLDLTIKAMNRVMDEMETLLARRGH
jgi:oligoendopeptidase F